MLWARSELPRQSGVNTSCLPPRCLQSAQRCREEEGRSWQKVEEHHVAAQNRNELTGARVAPAFGDPHCPPPQLQAGPSHQGCPFVPGSSSRFQRQKMRNETVPQDP